MQHILLSANDIGIIVYFLLLITMILGFILWLIHLIFYLLPKKLGFPKLAKLSISIVIVLIVGFVIYATTSKHEYNKDVVRDQLQRQNIELQDVFSIDDHYYTFWVGEFVDRFTLTISRRDKENIIKKIRNSPYYKEGEDGCKGFVVEYRGNDQEVCNCEDEEDVISHIYPMIKGKNYYYDIIIKVSKNENKLYFKEEDY